ncbi:MAG: MFS transporter [Planctomycetes bacterium]|nr:MFS transporter [Planctomycetota bacterium]MBL7144061.1 MFS transporter [Phycisphaerae bacterium]
MWFKTEEALTEEQVQSGLSYVIKDGIASQSMGILTGGAFLVAFAVKLGASNFVIGLLAAIGPLAQLLQLPSIFLVEKIRNRRAIVVVTATLSRLCWLFIALSPFLFGAKIGLAVLIVSMIAASALGAVSGCSWNSWMRDLIPQEVLGSFFSKRMRIATGVGIALSVLAAVYLDLWKKLFAEYEVQGYSILFLGGFAVGVLGLYYLYKTPEKRMPLAEEKSSILKLLSKPFKDENFRKLIVFMCSWNFAVNLAAPFFMVYMLKRLGLSMSFIIGLSILSQVLNFAFLKIWGKFTDRFSNKSVLAICGPLFIVSILAWTFTTMPEKYFLTFPLLIIIHIIMGLSSAGVSLASGNISMKLAPEGQATSYLAANTIANSIAAGIAPILGGKFADFFANRQLDWVLNYKSPAGDFSLPTLNLQQWDFFFVIAFIIGLYSIHRLSLIKEVGEVEGKVVFNELMTEVRSQVRTLSSVEGLRQMVSFPFTIVRDLTVKVKTNNNISENQEKGA